MKMFISILVSPWKESLLGMLLKTQDKYLTVFIREKKKHVQREWRCIYDKKLHTSSQSYKEQLAIAI